MQTLFPLEGTWRRSLYYSELFCTERLPSYEWTQNKYTCMTWTISVIFKVFSELVYDQMLYCPFYTSSLILLQMEISFISKNAFQSPPPKVGTSYKVIIYVGRLTLFCLSNFRINRNAPICGIPCVLKDLQPETQQQDTCASRP